MTIPEIARKYKISEAYLNSKDDGLIIAADSLKELKSLITQGLPQPQLLSKMQFLIDFLVDVKNSNH